jgi:hypothetical protein
MAIKYWTGASGDNDWSTAGNWNPSGVPVASDDVYITNSSVDISAGLGQSAILLASLHITQSYTGRIEGSASNEFLEIGATVCEIGEIFNGQTGTGSPKILLDLGTTNASTCTVTDTGVTTDGSNPLEILAGNSSTDIIVKGGTLSINGDLTARTIRNINIHEGDVKIDDNLTFTKLNIAGGSVSIDSDIADCAITSGTLDVVNGSNITTLDVDGGTVNISNNGTRTATTIEVLKGTLNLLECTSLTITNLKVRPGALVNIDTRFVTLTNDIELLTNGPEEVFTIQV